LPLDDNRRRIEMTELTTTTHDVAATVPARTRRPRVAFALHLGEMLLAMVAGMVVLGTALEGVLALFGTSMSAGSPALHAAVMGFNMTAPMAWWMHHRGHPAQHNAEMAGSMLVPTAAAMALYWAGAIAGDAVLVVQHVVMIPAMVAVMLWRRGHYSH
jgi:hypothetical protein